MGCGDYADDTKGEARLWDLRTGQPIGDALAPGQAITYPTIAFSPDGRIAVTAGTSRVAHLWEAATGKALAALEHDGSVLAVAFSPDSRILLTGSNRGEGKRAAARLWDARTGQTLGEPMEHPAGVGAVAFNPMDGGMFATGCNDGYARFWDVRTGQQVGHSLRHQGVVRSLAFSPDGSRLLTGSWDHFARLWDVAKQSQINPPLEHHGWVRVVAFSPADGKYLLTASFDNSARVWDAATHKPIGPPLLHGDWVVTIACSPDDRTVATGSGDGTARLWPVPAPAPDDLERVRLWVRVRTGLRLDDGAMVETLDAAAWQQDRERLEQLGGVP